MSPERIYLIGFMGCGKSTIGRKLAEALSYDFLDLDTLIESQQKKSISDIFKQQGEEDFRRIENAALQSTKNMNRVVIATGGGTPCFHDNIDWINKAGTSVYLKCAIDTLHQRLINSIDRPLVQGKTTAELRTYIQQTLRSRRAFYQQAKIRVLANVGLQATVQKVISKL